PKTLPVSKLKGKTNLNRPWHSGPAVEDAVDRSPPSIIAPLETTYGPKLAEAEAGIQIIYGDTFAATTGKHMSDLARTHGKATITLVGAGVNGAGSFFYEPAIIDTSTGTVYQEDAGLNHLYGHLVPPAAARLSGSFSAAQLGLVTDALTADGAGPP